MSLQSASYHHRKPSYLCYLSQAGKALQVVTDSSNVKYFSIGYLDSASPVNIAITSSDVTRKAIYVQVKHSHIFSLACWPLLSHIPLHSSQYFILRTSYLFLRVHGRHQITTARQEDPLPSTSPIQRLTTTTQAVCMMQASSIQWLTDWLTHSLTAEGRGHDRAFHVSHSHRIRQASHHMQSCSPCTIICSTSTAKQCLNWDGLMTLLPPSLSDTCSPLGSTITALLDGRHSLGSSVLFAVESERHHATQYTVLASYLKQHVVLAAGVPQAQYVTKGNIVYFSFRPLMDADLRWEHLRDDTSLPYRLVHCLKHRHYCHVHWVLILELSLLPSSILRPLPLCLPSLPSLLLFPPSFSCM